MRRNYLNELTAGKSLTWFWFPLNNPVKGQRSEVQCLNPHAGRFCLCSSSVCSWTKRTFHRCRVKNKVPSALRLCVSAAALVGRRLTLLSEARASISQQSTRGCALRANHGAPDLTAAANQNASPAPKHPPTAATWREGKVRGQKVGEKSFGRHDSGDVNASHAKFND